MKALFICLFVLSLNPLAQAESKKERLKSLGARLRTEHSFNGLNVNGHYQSAYDTVENEKPILDILDYPKTYKGRVKASKRWIR